MSAARDESGWRAGIRPGLGIAAAAAMGLLVLAVFVVWARDRQLARAAHSVDEGSIAVAGVFERVEVRRDASGIAHIRAGNALDGWAAMGFVHAQDRLAQMLWLRRLALGRSAEVVAARWPPSSSAACRPATKMP